MRNRIFVLVVLLVISISQAFSQGVAKGGMIADPGTIDVNAGIALGRGTGISGGLEYILGSFKINPIPLSYGVAGRVGLYFGNDMAASVGGLATLHLCLGAFKLPKDLGWMENFDIYMGLGLGISDTVRLGWLGGLAYYFNDNLAIYAEGGFVGSGLGVILKI